MEAMKEKLGSHHPDTLTCMASLASTYWQQGKLDEADALLSQAVKLMEKIMGSRHPTTIHLRKSLNQLKSLSGYT